MSGKNDKKYIIAHDHGTSGNKATLVDLDGNIIDFITVEYPILYPKPGWAEQDPEDWWHAVCEGTKKLLDTTGTKPEEIAAIVTSNQMWVTIPVDKDGNPLMNAISWLDSRGSKDVQKFFGGFPKIEGYSLSKLLKWMKLVGAPPSLAGKDNFGHILWIMKNHPEIYEKTYKFLDAKDYLNYKFTGKIFTSSGVAMLSFLADARDPANVVWSKDLLGYLGVSVDKMPPILKSSDIGGELTKEAADDLGLIPGIPVVVGSGDVQCAAIGSGATKINMPHICIGTSSWVAAHTPLKKVDISHYMGSIGSAIPGRYLFTSEQEVAGAALEFLKNNILYHKDELLKEEEVPDVFKIFDKLAESVPAGSSNLIFTPWLFGEKSPFEDHNARGILFNLSLDHTRAHLIRAIFEGVAYNIKWCFIYLEKNLKVHLPEIRIIGGGAQSAVWSQILADVFDRKIVQVANPKEAGSRGAALIASVALGHTNWDDIPNLVKVEKEYSPNPDNRKIYDKLFKQYQKLYKNNKKMFKVLNESH
ncbi:MAG: xylulokinase [Promethearchaeota archaeon]